jgi:hypothetical protein
MNRDSNSYIKHQTDLREAWLRKCALRENSARPPLEIYCKNCKVEKPHDYQPQELDVGLKAGFMCLSCDTGFWLKEDIIFEGL